MLKRTGRSLETSIAPQPPIDATAPYTSEEVFATAGDGDQGPPVHRLQEGTCASATASAPRLMLNAYGCPTALPRTRPSSPAGAPLLDARAGVFAVGHACAAAANWARTGIWLARSSTSPTPGATTIACAEHLVREGYTSKAKLAVVGGSAGGITVGRFMTERPDLAAVVIDQVGVSNASRSEFSPNGPPNIPEFGTVTEKDGFKALYEMDAVLHVKDGVKYPSVLLTTGLNDPRVPSWDPTKMTARLQGGFGNGGPNPIILRIDVDAPATASRLGPAASATRRPATSSPSTFYQHGRSRGIQPEVDLLDAPSPLRQAQGEGFT